MLTAVYTRKKKAVLVFCPSKKQCEDVAIALCRQLPLQFPEYADAQKTLEFTNVDEEITDLLKQYQEFKGPFKQEKVHDKELNKRRRSLISELTQCASGLCPILRETLPHGVAYHHSGLTSDEREIVEKGYREGSLLVLCATSTLSTGINLPAKAVIFKGPKIAMNLMDAAKYKQMSGRAGRTGFDAKGDSIMLCHKDEVSHVLDLIKPFQQELTSALTGSRLMRSLLEVISSGSISTFKDLKCYLSNTLKYTLCSIDSCSSCYKSQECNQALFVESPGQETYLKFEKFLDDFQLQQFKATISRDDCRNCLFDFVKMVIAYLRKFNFLIVDTVSVNVMPTQLGKAAFASSIPPEFSLQIFMDLAEAREHLVLESDLHLLYLLTPHFRDLRKPDWELCLRRFGQLT